MSRPGPASTTLTVRLPVTTKRRMERLAKASQRSKAFLTLEAIENYLDLQEWQLAAVKEGLRALEAGDTIPHAQVKDWLKTWGSDHETPPPWK